MRGRANTTATTATSKAAASTSRRTGGQARQNSDATRISSGARSLIVGTNLQASTHPKSSKIITMVDGIFHKTSIFNIFFRSFRHKYR
jgi:hypothetical protein